MTPVPGSAVSTRSRRSAAPAVPSAPATPPAGGWAPPARARRGPPPRAADLVDPEPPLRPVAQTEPADPRRESLERHPAGCQLEPALEQRVVGEEPAELL